jgi:PAS domain S-box-containing protein
MIGTMIADPRTTDPLAMEMLAACDDGIVALDTDLLCRYWSPAMQRLSGLEAGEMVGKPRPSVVPFLHTSGEPELLRRLRAGEEIDDLQPAFLLESSTGRRFYQARLRPWRAADGTALGLIAFVRDVTAVREVELRAHETESRFKTMADAAPVLLWMSGTDALCTFFNQTWLTFTGRSVEEEWGVGWAEGVHFEDFQACIDLYMEAFAARRVFEMEYRLRRHDGEYRWILDRGTPRFSPDGRFAGFIGSCIDITERKNLELDLTKSVKVRDEFLSIASHELRTPLAAMQLQVEGLGRVVQRHGAQSLPEGRLAHDLERTGNHVRRMTALVDTLLDISRLSEGRLTLDRKEMDLAAMIQEVARSMRPTAAAMNSELNVTAPATLTGCWDRFRLEQVVTNLIANAVKFGGGKPIDVTIDTTDQLARMVVRDRGIGIPRDQQRRIFERFERGVSTRHFGGFGLGLWISKQIVVGHRGTIEVESRPGEGATFTVKLPPGD